MDTGFDYDGVRFRAADAPDGPDGRVSLGRYRQRDGEVWVEYAGGSVLAGRLVGTTRPDGTIDGAYCQVSADGQTAAGTLVSVPERLPDGRIRLRENWRRADGSSGVSVIDQVADPDAHGSLSEARLGHLRDSVFARLRAHLAPVDLQAAARCAVRLLDRHQEDRALSDLTVLVAYGGGKDSSYTLAFVRAMQLIAYRTHGETFTVRSVTNRQTGMPQAVMDNIDRAYRALGLDLDPQGELLLVEGERVRAFDRTAPISPELVERTRRDILMAGHRTAGDARPTFCNACNLSMVNAFGVAAAHRGGVDVIITGDSAVEQRDYFLWVRRLMARFKLGAARGRQPGLRSFLASVDSISRAYFADLSEDGPHAERGIAHEVPEQLPFFSIYEDTSYESGAHWGLLTELLEFEFDESSFWFTESDCANPGLMAHLRALKTEHAYGGNYADGLAEYADYAIGLMRDKQFPEQLTEVMRERYARPGAAGRLRELMDAYGLEAHGIAPRQWVCLVFAPFVDEAAGLERYLAAEHPDLVAQAGRLRELLSGAETRPAPQDEALLARLTEASGLSPGQMRGLYRHSRPGNTAVIDSSTLLGAILEGDPHKAVIKTRHSPGGPLVHELISGR